MLKAGKKTAQTDKTEKKRSRKRKRFHLKKILPKWSSKNIRNGSYSIGAVVIVIAIVVVVNMIVGELPSGWTSFDLSDSGLYSIGDTTKDAAGALEEDVSIYLIAESGSEDDLIVNLLERYEELSSHITVEQIDPVLNPNFTSQYTDDTVDSNSVIVVSEKRSKVINYTDMYETTLDYSTYSYQTTGFDGEGQITSAIDYVTTDNMPVMYVLQGHDELSMTDTMTELIEKGNIEIQELNLVTAESVPEDADCLFIYGPQRDLSEEEAEKIYAESSCDAIAVFWDDKSFQICPDDGTDREFIFPVRENLLDVGFFLHSLFPALRTVFTGGKRVILYNSKEIRHRLHDLGIAFTAPFEDVSLEKYIAEGMSNSDSLEFCLDSHSLPSRCKAHGILRLWNTFGEMLDDAERKLYFEIEKPLSVLLFEMELSGVSIDRGALEEFSVRYGTELKELTQKIYALAGETFNLNSPVQLGKILFEKLRIGSGSKSKGKRNYSTTAEVLEKYADDYEIVRLLLRYRQIQKLNSTYVEGFRPLIGSDGKVHTTYNQMNTSTGRLSSANPNLQNIPVRNDEGKELRKLFIASPGNVLIDADYSQIELRLLAHFSGCKELIEAYREHRDIHAITASQVFGVPLDKVTPQMRRSAKAVNFGIIYGISSFGLAKDLGISAKRAGEYIDKYFQTYSDVKKYMDENVERAKRDGYITTLCGRRRVINELKSSNYNVRSFGERAAMNMPLQGSSADIIKIAMINVRKKLSEAGLRARLVLQVHDELVLDCPEREKDAASEILQREMENAVSLKVPLTVEIACGKSWFSAK
mgnify:CR=1 FL=1